MNKHSYCRLKSGWAVVVAALCAACGGPADVITEFPETRALTSEVWKIPSDGHYPQAMVVSGNYLIVHNVKSENLIQVFDTKTREFLYEGGEIGRGGNDFEGEPDRSTMHATEDGFEIRVNHEWYRVAVGPTELRVKEKFSLGDIKQPVANALSLGNGLFCAENVVSDRRNKAFCFFNVNTKHVRYAVPYPTRQLKAYVKSASDRGIAYSKTSVAHPSGEKIASFYSYYKAFQIISTKGDVLRTVRIDITPFAASFSNESDSRFFAYISNPVTDGRLIYVLCASSQEEKSFDTSATELQVFDWDGNPVASYTLDHYANHIALDGKTIYAVNSMLPGQIFVYSL